MNISEKQPYEKIGYDDLVVYGVYSLAKAGKEATYENVVAECFNLFPRRFAMRGYSNWPDSAIVNKRWVSCRYRGLLLGSVKDGFQLTPSGEKLAFKVEKMLKKERPILKREANDIRTRESRFVKAIEKSDAFRVYESKGIDAPINDFDFCAMLMCTLDSDASVLRKNLDQFIQYCQFMERQDLVEFLFAMKNRFQHLLRPKAMTPRDSYVGGMQKKKLT